MAGVAGVQNTDDFTSTSPQRGSRRTISGDKCSVSPTGRFPGLPRAKRWPG